MKTKIKLLLVGLISLVTIVTSSVVVADKGAYFDGQTCNGVSCKQFHETGIGFYGPYEGGLTFPSFNNYYNYETEDGRIYDERQFTYIQKAGINGVNMPYPTPWDYNPSYQFTQSDIEHELYFTGEPNEKKRFGMWVYMHNNGIGGQNIFANDVNVKVDHWGSANPQLSFSPRAVIDSNNTKPNTIWADVDITSNNEIPFTITPVEGSISKLEGKANLHPNDLSDLTHTPGVYVKTGSTIKGKFNSSQDYYVLLYVEFEATSYPEDKGVCRNLTITTPDGGANNEIIVTEPLNNLPLSITIDSDDGAYDQFQYVSTPFNGGITFNNTSQKNIYTDSTTVNLNGLPGSGQPGSTQTISVFAVDEEQAQVIPCEDKISFIYSPDDEGPICEVLNTKPGSLGDQPIELNSWVRINLDGPRDTNGDPFMVEGENPLISYCFTNENIDFRPYSGITYPQSDPKCLVVPKTDPVDVYASEQGTMTIDVLDTEVAACADSFETEENQYEGECISLYFIPDGIDFDGIDEYCVNLDLEPEVTGYNNDIQWNINNDEHTFTTSYPNDNSGTYCIYEDDFPEDYIWTSGDSLEAVALIEGDCEDIIDSEDIPCTDFELIEDYFEKGKDNLICIDHTDWPVEKDGLSVDVDEDGEEDYSIDGDDIVDDCFYLDENWLDDTDRVEIWVPGWYDECRAHLDYKVFPPDFDKNVKDEDPGSSFSSRAAINFSDDNVDYQITYEHKNVEDQDVTITDTIGRVGFIQGYITSTTANINNETPRGGKIRYEKDSMIIEVDGNEIDDCDTSNDRICYNGSIGDEFGVEIRNVPPREEVVITYSGEVDTVVSPSNCSDPTHDLVTEGAVCGEIYPNVAEFDDEAGFDGDDDADVIIPCPFIIIRSGGEVFLENPFDYGVDTLSCSEIENVPVPIITPDFEIPELSKQGEGESIMAAFSDRLCKNEEIAGYEDIKNISSLICEITLKTSDDLTQFAIVQNIARNIDLFARYDKVLDDYERVRGSSELPQDVQSKVYVKKNSGNLKLGGEFSDGAQTIVVIGGNVEITENITFKDPLDLTDPRQIPSLALIVIGGDIIVAPEVTETNGIFFVQEGEDGEGGRMCEGTCAENDQYNENPLVHYGSIYGDIQHLFKYRTFAGDPTKEEAAILIRFDNRIYLNTPPILGELVNVTSDVF